MDVRVQQDYPPLQRHGVGRIREPREDDLVVPYASRARIDILRAEEELTSPDQVRVGFSILGACTEGKQEREHQGAEDNHVGSIHTILLRLVLTFSYGDSFAPKSFASQQSAQTHNIAHRKNGSPIPSYVVISRLFGMLSALRSGKQSWCSVHRCPRGANGRI